MAQLVGRVLLLSALVATAHALSCGPYATSCGRSADGSCLYLGPLTGDVNHVRSYDCGNALGNVTAGEPMTDENFAQVSISKSNARLAGLSWERRRRHNDAMKDPDVTTAIR
jgi:hypothetical protein